MILSNSVSIKAPYWPENMLAETDDLNEIINSMYVTMANVLGCLHTPAQASETASTGSAVVVGRGARLLWSSGRTAYLQPGVVLSYKGDYTPGPPLVFSASTGVLAAVIVDTTYPVLVDSGHHTYVRIDTIEIEPTQAAYDSETRRFRNPSTGVVTQSSVNTRIGYGAAVYVRKGTPAASPVGPAPTAGRIKIAEVHVPANATTLSQKCYWQAEQSSTWSSYPLKAIPSIQQDQEILTSPVSVTSSTTLTVNKSHICNATEALTLTLPIHSEEGDIIEIIDIGGSRFTIASAGWWQHIRTKQTLSATTVTASVPYARVMLRCSSPDLLWRIIRSSDPNLQEAS